VATGNPITSRPGELKPEVQNRITSDGPLLPVILRLAGPVVLMMYLQNAYSIIDTIWVGQLLGRDALAGIGAGGYLLWGIFGLTALVTVGIGATVARRIGEGNVRGAQQTATRGLWYSFAVSVVIAAMLWVALPLLFEVMKTGPEVTRHGILYMRVLLLGTPFIFISFTQQTIFQAAGDTITPMWTKAITLLINLVLDPILMLGLWGFPAMGIGGAALATVIARLVWVAIGMYLLTAGKRIGQQDKGPGPFGWLKRMTPKIKPGMIQLDLAGTEKWRWDRFWQILRLGIPNAISLTLFPAVYIFIVRIPAEFGAHQIAALRVGHTVEGMSFYLALGFSMAAATCVGQNLGAQKPERAARSVWVATALVSGILLAFSFCFYFLARQTAAIFTPDAETIAASAVYLQILAWSQLFMGIEIAVDGGFNGAGNTVPPMLINTPLNLARIPIAYFLAFTLDWGVVGVWWAISGTSIVKGVLNAGWFALGRWKEQRV
jgi:MATE family, multidrug efflux pump